MRPLYTAMLSEPQFNELRAQGYSHIPFVRQILADFDTPLSTYYRLARQPYTYLFESVQGGEKWGRYSIIGLASATRIEVHGYQLSVLRGTSVLEQWISEDPLADIQAFHNRYRMPDLPDLPRFSGGLVGFFGYDTVRYIEPVLGQCPHPSSIDVPDICLMVSDEVVVFDNLSGRLFIVVYRDTSSADAWHQGNSRLDEIVEDLKQSTLPDRSFLLNRDVKEMQFESAFGQAAFEQAVEQAREYILSGDAFQVVLSQRLSAQYSGDPINLYRAIRTLNPSPYMYYINLDGYCVVGSSPEILVRSEDGMVTVRPLAGTRPRGADDAEDELLATELLADEKERAEHVMLVDLGRNDVGRVSKTGTVRISDVMTIEYYSHVMHIVSNVTGELIPGLDAIDVLRAALPAGTVSGAPKVRAMEIIDELEPTKRGIYAGAVGYIGWNGNLDTAIAIRTAVVANGRVYVQAGAGIVADSVPSREWNETMQKAGALMRAVSMADETSQDNSA